LIGEEKIKEEEIKTIPYHYLNLIYPVKEERGLKSFTIFLKKINKKSNPIVRVSLLHPIDFERFYIDFDFEIKSQILEIQIKTDGAYFPENSNFWVQIISTHTIEISPTIYIEWENKENVIQAFVDKEIRSINESFIARMSSNRFVLPTEKKEENFLYRRLNLLRRLMPENEIVKRMYYWARFEKWPEFDFSDYKEKYPDAPEWAIYAKELLEEITKQIHFWIDKRQDETGYIVGRGNQWNDVTKLLNKYSFLPLITDDKKVIRGIEKYLDAHWNISGWVEDGYCKRLTDIIHSSEEASYLQPAMLILKFGDKRHIEMAEKTAEKMDFWMGINELGHYHFRSNYFSAKKIITEGIKGWEIPQCGRAISSALILSWVDPESKYRGKIIKWMDSLLEDYLRETPDKPANQLPTGIRFKDDYLTSKRWIGVTKFYIPYLTGCYLWTGNYKYLKPVEDLLKKLREGKASEKELLYIFRQAIFTWRKITGISKYDDILLNSSFKISSKIAKKRILEDEFWQRGVSYLTIPCLWAFRITNNKKWLILALKHALRNNVRAYPIYTILDPSTDRVYPWGRWVLPEMYLGGMVLNMESSLPYPTHIISWENSGTDFAAIVTKKGKKNLDIEIFDFHPTKRKIFFRIWSLPDGNYKLIVKKKKESKWVILEKREIYIHRGKKIPLFLTPKKLYQIKLTYYNAW
ncbi:hypothetical protein J7L87_00855, partial [bacterium]|nr:hypothetical protein [bacterium]